MGNVLAWTHLYMSPAERLVVFDRCGLGSPARLMSGEKTRHRYVDVISGSLTSLVM